MRDTNRRTFFATSWVLPLPLHSTTDVSSLADQKSRETSIDYFQRRSAIRPEPKCAESLLRYAPDPASDAGCPQYAHNRKIDSATADLPHHPQRMLFR